MHACFTYTYPILQRYRRVLLSYPSPYLSLIIFMIFLFVILYTYSYCSTHTFSSSLSLFFFFFLTFPFISNSSLDLWSSFPSWLDWIHFFSLWANIGEFVSKLSYTYSDLPNTCVRRYIIGEIQSTRIYKCPRCSVFRPMLL